MDDLDNACEKLDFENSSRSSVPTKFEIEKPVHLLASFSLSFSDLDASAALSNSKGISCYPIFDYSSPTESNLQSLKQGDARFEFSS